MVSLASDLQGDIMCSTKPRGAPASGLITSHRDLAAWQRSYRLGLAIYEVTLAFPDDERFGLTSQLRRGAVAVASNIAEGRARNSKPDFVRFLRISMGALAEIDTQLRFAGDLDYITPGQCGRLLLETSECGKLTNALINGLRRSINAERNRRRNPKPSSGSPSSARRLPSSDADAGAERQLPTTDGVPDS